jgi:hypothetical protein
VHGAEADESERHGNGVKLDRALLKLYTLSSSSFPAFQNRAHTFWNRPISPRCCEQQTSMHEMVVEALLTIYLFYLGSELIPIDVRKPFRSSACLVRYS